MIAEYLYCVALILASVLLWSLAADAEHGAPHKAKALLSSGSAVKRRESETGAPQPPGASFPSFSGPGHLNKRE